jgi:hypothetical protein
MSVVLRGGLALRLNANNSAGYPTLRLPKMSSVLARLHSSIR